MTNAVSPTTPKNQFAVVDSCITFNDALSTTPGDEGFGVLQIALAYDVNRFRPSHKLQQFFGNLFYLANNALLYNKLPAKTKNLQGSQNIVPACKGKDNQDAHLTFWYNMNTRVLKVTFSVAVPYYYASAISKSLSTLASIKSGLAGVYSSSWLTTALVQVAKETPPSCFVNIMRQLGKPSVSVTCSKAELVKEVHEEEAAERKLRVAATTNSEVQTDEAKEVQAGNETERRLGPVKIQAKGAVKVKGGGVTGKATTTLGGR